MNIVHKNSKLLTFRHTVVNHAIVKNIPLSLLIIFLYGCSVSPINNNDTSGSQSAKQVQAECKGSNDLPPEYADAFEQTVDDAFLKRALGSTDNGGLCQGKVYISKKGVFVPIYRAWNSSNPNSRFGKWWAFNLPNGKIAQYRKNYEICYQFSPLDKLTYCNLKPNTKIVIGTGQSVKCDNYLTYPTSETKQIYIEISDTPAFVSDCKDYDGLFNWKPISE